jgi:2-dehydropantoate 2-reductase
VKAAIVGAGGIGRALAAMLSRAGHDVTLVFRTAEAARLVANDGLHVTGIDDFEARITSRASRLEGQYDLAVLATKTYDMECALQQLDPMAVDVVLSAQNGVRKDELLESWAPGRAIGAVVQITASQMPATGVRIAAIESSFAGELDGSPSPRVDRIAGELTSAGIPTESVSHIRALQWTKLVSWIPSSLLSVVTRLPLPTICDDRELALVYLDVAREIAAVAAALDHGIVDDGELVGSRLVAGDRSIGVSALRQTAASLRAGSAGDYRSSMLLDLLACRPLELEDTAGHVLQLAESSGIEVPVTRSLVRLSRAAAASMATS